jgi:hypothetical protein
VFSLHSEALAWLRFAKRMPVVCTEAGPFYADVLGMNTSMCIEVEIKKSISDLRAEFREKTHKHLIYGRGDTVRSSYAPNYFYFMVPGDISAKAKEILDEKFPRAGLAAVQYPSLRGWDVGKNIVVVKRPTKLHDRPPGTAFVRQAVMRMASEIAHFRIVLDGMKKRDVTEPLVRELLGHVQGLEGAMDFEDVVSDVKWDDMSHVDRIKAIFKAQELLHIKREQVKMPDVEIT